MRLTRLAVIGVLALSGMSAAQAAVTGTPAKTPVLTADQKAALLDYVKHHYRLPFIDSYGLKVGRPIAEPWIRYYKLPRRIGAPQYRYTLINDQIVLVDAASHKVVAILD